MDRSYRDKTSDRIDAKATAAEIETKLDTALVGVAFTNVIATEVPDGAATEFNFAGTTGLIANSEIVTVDGVQQIRTIDYNIAGAVVTFIAGHIPAGGTNVVMNCTIATTW